MNKHEVAECEIPNKGLRVTPADIEASIASEHYFNAGHAVIGTSLMAAVADPLGSRRKPEVPAPLHLLTFCVLVLRNGFTVTGESACASPENFDAEIGKRIARQNAVQKIWPLLGFRLRDQLHTARLADAAWSACEGGNDPASAPAL